VHNWQLSDDAEGYVVFFNAGFYLLNHAQGRLSEFPFFGYAATPHLPLTEAHRSTITPLLVRLYEEYGGHAWRKEELLGSYLNILLIKLANAYRQTNAPAGSSHLLEQLRQLEWAHRKALPRTQVGGGLRRVDALVTQAVVHGLPDGAPQIAGYAPPGTPPAGSQKAAGAHRPHGGAGSGPAQLRGRFLFQPLFQEGGRAHARAVPAAVPISAINPAICAIPAGRFAVFLR
jgi:hypothetical protein